jgi:hypothetical protein
MTARAHRDEPSTTPPSPPADDRTPEEQPASRSRRLTYRGRMIAGLLLVSVPVILLLVVALVGIANGSIDSAVRRANIERAAGAASRVDVWLAERELDMDSLAGLIETSDPDDVELASDLRRRQALGEDFSVLQVLDADGELVAASARTRALDPGDHAWFGEAAAGRSVTSTIYRDGDEIRMVIARPLGGTDDEPDRVLAANVRVEQISELIGAADFQDSAEILVANARARLIYSTDSGIPESSSQLLLDGALTTQVDTGIVRLALEGEGAGRFVDYKGEDVFGGYAPIGDTGLIVQAKANASEALAPVTRLVQTGILVGLLGVLVLIGFAAIFARRESGFLRRLTASTEEAAGEVRRQAESMSASAIELAMTTNEQSATVTETSTTIEELSRSAATIADTAKDVAHQTTSTRDNLARAESEIQESSRQTLELADGVRRISDILELINDISEQTNMLALNAAIEAARAGEAGEGFAVVADEVRRLAERSKVSSDDIAEIVSSTMAQMNATLLTMERGTKQMHAGLDLLEEVAVAAEQVRTTTEQQLSATDQVVQSMGQASEAAGQVSETADQIASTATGLVHTAEALEQSASEARGRF